MRVSNDPRDNAPNLHTDADYNPISFDRQAGVYCVMLVSSSDVVDRVSLSQFLLISSSRIASSSQMDVSTILAR